MKVILALLSALALALPYTMANPVPEDHVAAAVPAVVEAAQLVPRAINDPCTVSGRGNLNVLTHPASTQER